MRRIWRCLSSGTCCLHRHALWNVRLHGAIFQKTIIIKEVPTVNRSVLSYTNGTITTQWLTSYWLSCPRLGIISHKSRGLKGNLLVGFWEILKRVQRIVTKRILNNYKRWANPSVFRQVTNRISQTPQGIMHKAIPTKFHTGEQSFRFNAWSDPFVPQASSWVENAANYRIK